MRPETIMQLVHSSTRHDPDILTLEQSAIDLKKQAEAENLRVADILIPPCSAIATQFKLHGLLMKLNKLPLVNGLTDTEIVTAITKAVVLVGLVNSIINIVNVKLLKNEKIPGKHGLDLKAIDSELYYSLEREPIDGEDYVYKVQTVANSGEILTTKVPFSQIIRQLLADPLTPLDSLEVSLNGVTTTFSQWTVNFKKTMIQTW